MPGKFIVLEGPEGGGKTLQSQLLARRLQDEGFSTVLTHEPGGTAIGKDIRSILLGLDSYDVQPKTEAFLLAAGRVQHIHEVISPALRAGRFVVCDRFVDSTYAYQGGGRGIPIEQLRQIQNIATDGLVPDLKILLDLPVELGLHRRGSHVTGEAIPVQMGFDDGLRTPFAGRRGVGQSETNKIDMIPVEFHRRVRDMYLALMHESPHTWVKVDATASVDQVESEIWSAVEAMIL